MKGEQYTVEQKQAQGVGLIANEETILNEFSQKKQLFMDFQDDLEDIIPTLLKTRKIETANIAFRIKSEESLRKKIQFKHKYQQLTDVTDLVGCRVITLFETDVEAVLQALESEFELVELVDKRKKSVNDYVDFGYNSLHVILKMSKARCALVEYKRYEDIRFEVQIRTALQHAWGEIEHGLGYKSDFEIPMQIRRKLTRIAATLELIDEEFETIRQEVAEYDRSFDKIEKILKTDINKNTLIQYYETGAQIRAFNQSLTEAYGLELVEDSGFISRLKIVQRLQFLGFRYIHEMDEFIQTHQAPLRVIADKWMEIMRGKSLNVYTVLLYTILLASAREAADLYDENGPVKQMMKLS